MPNEYPARISDLQRELAQRFVSPEALEAVLALTALRNPEGKSLTVIIGAGMRGIAGSERRVQHLACWHIGPKDAATLRDMAIATDEGAKISASAAFKEWMDKATVEWCPVRENRPEIVLRRDSGSRLAWWHGKRVTMLGCGALGSAIAPMLARAGIRKVLLVDNSAVGPGLLVRQGFNWRQIGYTKSSACRNNMRRIAPQIEVEEHSIDVIDALRSESERMFDADVVLNTTASARVSTALEKHFAHSTCERPPIVSMAIGHRAEQGLVTLAIDSVPGVAIDLDRRMKIALANSMNGADFLEEFWPTAPERARLFQPEPGCSDPTFVGSAADVLGLAAAMLNVASGWLDGGSRDVARGCAIRALHLLGQGPQGQEFTWPADRSLVERRNGYKLRISKEAEQEILGWMRRGDRIKRGAETGGLLFGQVDEFLRIIWVTEASGPPPDSICSDEEFVCGVAGTKELSAEKQLRTRGAVRFVGMWHTHPDGPAEPSERDLNSMQELWSIPEPLPRSFLMLIVGGTSRTSVFEGFLFGRAERAN
jgi:proteasome lid subunit RPN8/RPN11